MNKQAKFEMFLEAQERKEQANLKRDLQNDIMPALVRHIKEFGQIIDHPNWEGKTLPRLREGYKVLQAFCDNGDPSRFKVDETLQDMLFWLNGWNRSTGKKFEFKRESDPCYHGEASLTKRFYLEIIEVERS